MPALRQARVQECTRVRLTPRLAAVATSPAIKALPAKWVVTREDEQAVSTASDAVSQSAAKGNNVWHTAMLVFSS